MDPTVIRHTKASFDINAIIAALKKNMVKSKCPEGCLRIENLYWDPETEELVWVTE